MPQGCTPVVQITTPLVHASPPANASAAFAICFTVKHLQGIGGFSWNPTDRLYPTGTVMVLTFVLHATRRTQAALGAAGRYNSVAPSNSQRKWFM